MCLDFLYAIETLLRETANRMAPTIVSLFFACMAAAIPFADATHYVLNAPLSVSYPLTSSACSSNFSRAVHAFQQAAGLRVMSVCTSELYTTPSGFAQNALYNSTTFALISAVSAPWPHTMHPAIATESAGGDVDTLWAFGGRAQTHSHVWNYNGQNITTHSETSSLVRYSTVQNVVQFQASAPVPTSGSLWPPDVWPFPSAQATLVYLSNCSSSGTDRYQPCLVLYGGCVGESSVLDELWVYTPHDALWSRQARVQGEAPPPLCKAAAIAAKDGASLYLYGGETVGGRASASTWHLSAPVQPDTLWTWRRTVKNENVATRGEAYMSSAYDPTDKWSSRRMNDGDVRCTGEESTLPGGFISMAHSDWSPCGGVYMAIALQGYYNVTKIAIWTRGDRYRDQNVLLYGSTRCATCWQRHMPPPMEDWSLEPILFPRGTVFDLQASQPGKATYYPGTCPASLSRFANRSSCWVSDGLATYGNGRPLTDVSHIVLAKKARWPATSTTRCDPSDEDRLTICEIAVWADVPVQQGPPSFLSPGHAQYTSAKDGRQYMVVRGVGGLFLLDVQQEGWIHASGAMVGYNAAGDYAYYDFGNVSSTRRDALLVAMAPGNREGGIATFLRDSSLDFVVLGGWDPSAQADAGSHGSPLWNSMLVVRNPGGRHVWPTTGSGGLLTGSTSSGVSLPYPTNMVVIAFSLLILGILGYGCRKWYLERRGTPSTTTLQAFPSLSGGHAAGEVVVSGGLPYVIPQQYPSRVSSRTPGSVQAPQRTFTQVSSPWHRMNAASWTQRSREGCRANGMECTICLENVDTAAQFTCGHMACTGCAAKLTVCHLCRKRISLPYLFAARILHLHPTRLQSLWRGHLCNVSVIHNRLSTHPWHPACT